MDTVSGRDTLPKVGVVILNYNNYWDTIRYIKESLYIQKMIDLSVVIVDNASTNDSVPEINQAFPDKGRITVIQNNVNSGFSAGNNTGIYELEKKNCEYILISNNDVEISDNLLIRKLIDNYNGLDDAMFIAPLMMSDGSTNCELSAWKIPGSKKELLSSGYLLRFIGHRYLKNYYYDIYGAGKDIIKADCVAGSFFMGKVSSFREVGYFDENVFLYYEETILGQKVRDSGKSSYLCCDLTYNHIGDLSIRTRFSRVQKLRLLFKSRSYYWKRYREASPLFLIILRILFWINVAETCILYPFRILIKRKK